MITKEKIINDSKNIAVESIKTFLKNIGINPDEFNNIYQIKIDSEAIEQVDNENITAVYYNRENRIAVNNSVLEEYIDDIRYQEATENRVILNVAIAIIHEMIHAMRTVKKININNKLETNLISEFYYGDNENEAEKVIEQQNELEEIITESLSIIIFLNRNKEIINLEETNEVIEENEEDDNVVFGSEILTEHGLDKIKGFLLASKKEIKKYDFEEDIKKYNKIKSM